MEARLAVPLKGSPDDMTGGHKKRALVEIDYNTAGDIDVRGLARVRTVTKEHGHHVLANARDESIDPRVELRHCYDRWTFQASRGNSSGPRKSPGYGLIDHWQGVCTRRGPRAM